MGFRKEDGTVGLKMGIRRPADEKKGSHPASPGLAADEYAVGSACHRVRAGCTVLPGL
jgi:hypothetical protein